MPECDNRVHTGRPDGRIDTGNEAHRNGEKHGAQTQPPGEIKIIDKGNALPGQKVIDDSVDEVTPTNAPFSTSRFTFFMAVTSILPDE